MKLKAICGSIREYASVVIYNVDFVKSMMISGGIGLSALCIHFVLSIPKWSVWFVLSSHVLLYICHLFYDNLCC